MSRRMGVDKALIEINGKPLFTRSLDLLRRHFPAVIIAGDRPDLAPPGIPAIPDIYPGSALGGLFTGLNAAKTDWIFTAPCDMPCPDSRFLIFLADHRQGYDVVVPRTPNGFEPVFALYNKSCLPYMENLLKRNRFRIYDFFPQVKTRIIGWRELPEDWERGLLNLNNPEKLARYKGQRSLR